MPRWNGKLKQYEEEKITLFPKRETEVDEREERFRTALLNELDRLTDAVRGIEIETTRSKADR